MRKPKLDAHQTPTIQVIERMFSLIDVLASRAVGDARIALETHLVVRGTTTTAPAA